MLPCRAQDPFIRGMYSGDGFIKGCWTLWVSRINLGVGLRLGVGGSAKPCRTCGDGCKQGYDKRGNLGKQRVLVIVSCTFLELAACPRLALVVWGLHVPTDFRNHAQFRPLANQVSKA